MPVIREDEGAAERQRQEIEERHEREADARPDPIHRAVLFLLREAMRNNRDLSREANFHIQQLDAKMGADPDKTAEVDAAEPLDAVQIPGRPQNSASHHAPKDTTPAGAPKDSAKALRQSRRFKRD